MDTAFENDQLDWKSIFTVYFKNTNYSSTGAKRLYVPDGTQNQYG